MFVIGDDNNWLLLGAGREHRGARQRASIVIDDQPIVHVGGGAAFVRIGRPHVVDSLSSGPIDQGRRCCWNSSIGWRLAIGDHTVLLTSSRCRSFAWSRLQFRVPTLTASKTADHLIALRIVVIIVRIVIVIGIVTVATGSQAFGPLWRRCSLWTGARWSRWAVAGLWLDRRHPVERIRRMGR